MPAGATDRNRVNKKVERRVHSQPHVRPGAEEPVPWNRRDEPERGEGEEPAEQIPHGRRKRHSASYSVDSGHPARLPEPGSASSSLDPCYTRLGGALDGVGPNPNL